MLNVNKTFEDALICMTANCRKHLDGLLRTSSCRMAGALYSFCLIPRASSSTNLATSDAAPQLYL